MDFSKIVADSGVVDASHSNDTLLLYENNAKACKTYIDLVKDEIGNDVRLESNFFYPVLFLKQPYILLNNNAAFHATAFRSCLLYFQEYINEMIPLEGMVEEKKASYSFQTSSDGTKTPINLKPLLRVTMLSIREYGVIKYLNKSRLCNKSYPFYKQIVALAQDNIFNFNPFNKNFDVMLSSEQFIRLGFSFGAELPVLYHHVIMYSALYQSVLLLIEQIKKNLHLKSFGYYDLRRFMRDVIGYSHELVDLIDRSKIQDDPSGPAMNSNNLSNQNIPGKRSLHNNWFMSSFLLSGIKSYGRQYQKEIAGAKVDIEYLKALPQVRRFEDTSRSTKAFVNDVTQHLNKLIIKNLVYKIEPFEYSGRLVPFQAYRRQASDLKIFEYIDQNPVPTNYYNLFFLVDNSCSINLNKQKIMAKVLTVLANVFIRFPMQFKNIVAFSQHSSGNHKVTIRELVSAPTDKLKNSKTLLSKILHLHSSGVNYDSYCAFEILDIHKKIIIQNDCINLLFLIGDSWPVRYSNSSISVEEESKKVFDLIRKSYESLIIIYISTDAQYPPEKFYDYFIDLKTNSFHMQNFVTQFKNVIKKIISDEYKKPVSK